MLSKNIASEIVNVTLDWKQFYVTFRERFSVSPKPVQETPAVE